MRRVTAPASARLGAPGHGVAPLGERRARRGARRCCAGRSTRACTRWTCRRPAEVVASGQGRRCEVAVVRLAGAVDEAGYLAHNPPQAERGAEPVDHFCRRGWRAAAQPEPRLRRVVVLGGVPRPDRRLGDRDQPAGPLPGRRPAPRAAAAPPAAPRDRVLARRRRRAGPACSRSTTPTAWSTTTSSTTSPSWPGTPTSSCWPTASCSPASSTGWPGAARVRGCARHGAPRLRLVEPAGPRAGRLGGARGVRRGAARQRQLLAAPAARRGLRADGPADRATSGGCR